MTKTNNMAMCLNRGKRYAVLILPDGNEIKIQAFNSRASARLYVSIPENIKVKFITEKEIKRQ